MNNIHYISLKIKHVWWICSLYVYIHTLARCTAAVNFTARHFAIVFLQQILLTFTPCTEVLQCCSVTMSVPTQTSPQATPSYRSIPATQLLYLHAGTINNRFLTFCPFRTGSQLWAVSLKGLPPSPPLSDTQISWDSEWDSDLTNLLAVSSLIIIPGDKNWWGRNWFLLIIKCSSCISGCNFSWVKYLCGQNNTSFTKLLREMLV